MREQVRMNSGGFTLIELSIVLVIIGLIVGGVLTGQDLIRSAEVRAQISQIEKYNTAVNTFNGKYHALPGDMNATAASQFGFSTVNRASICPATGEPCGDGNGILEEAEQTMFWVDLSSPVAGGLIDGSFTAGAGYSQPPFVVLLSNAISYLPPAKIGGGNYIWVSSGGWSRSDGLNYFSLATPNIEPDYWIAPQLTLTVSQAYAIDKKMDDGMPQSGNVTAFYSSTGAGDWAAGGGGYGAADGGFGGPTTTATSPSATTCYDNGGGGGPMQYSLSYHNGVGPNCALSFRFQ
jgi:prepilin-type N-terminal cleavage/methylation domain-containing protein